MKRSCPNYAFYRHSRDTRWLQLEWPFLLISAFHCSLPKHFVMSTAAWFQYVSICGRIMMSPVVWTKACIYHSFCGVWNLEAQPFLLLGLDTWLIMISLISWINIDFFFVFVFVYHHVCQRINWVESMRWYQENQFKLSLGHIGC